MHGATPTFPRPCSPAFRTLVFNLTTYGWQINTGRRNKAIPRGAEDNGFNDCSWKI